MWIQIANKQVMARMTQKIHREHGKDKNEKKNGSTTVILLPLLTNVC